MASNNAFGLLLMALDEKKSAAEINKQLNSSAFKTALEEIKMEFKLDETAFQKVTDFLSGQKIDVNLVKQDVQELIDLYGKLPTQKLNNQNAVKRQDMLNIASSKGLTDATSMKEIFDADTGELKAMNIEMKTAEDTIRRIKIYTQDGIWQTSDITVTNELNKGLNLIDKQMAINTKSLKNLLDLDAKQGANAERTANIEKLKERNFTLQQTAVAKIEEALKQNQITDTQALALKKQITDEYQEQLTILGQHETKIADTTGFKEAKQALNDYKKDYNELLKLELKAQTSPEGLTQAEAEQLQILRQRIQGQEVIINQYETTKGQLTEIKTRADQAFKVDFAQAEIENINKEVSSLSKLYIELDKQKKKAFEGDLKNKPDIEAQKRVEALEEEIRVRREALEVSRQTSDGQIAATNALNQVEQEALSLAEVRQERERQAIATKEQVLNSTRGTILANQQFNTSLFESERAIDSNTVEIQEFVQKLHGGKAAIHDVAQATDSYGNSLLKVTGIADAGDDKVSKFTYYIDQQTGAVRRLSNELSNNVSRSMKFSEQISHAAKKMAVWGVAAKALYGTLRLFREGLTFISDLDKDLTQAAIVTGQNRQQVQGLADDYAKLGIEMGKTVSEISKVNTELLRQGLTIEESSKRLETIIKLSATGQITTEESLRVVTTAVNAMQESHEHAADVILRASNISASSVEQLGEAFTKTASSAFATGMEIEQVTGILATMLEVTQEGPSQLGTSLKTILARFSRVNEETGEWNENLNQVQKAIESVGVNFVDADGQIRNVYDILQDLSEIWPTLTKNQQAYVATTSAGVRMQNRFFAVMNNFDRVKTITEETAKSAGTMNRAYITYLDSVEAASNRTKASLEQLWISTIDSGYLTFFYDLMSGIIQTINQIGLFNTALIALSGYLIMNTKLVNGLALALVQLKTASTTATLASTSVAKGLIEIGVAGRQAAAAAKLGGAAFGGLKAGILGAASQIPKFLGPHALVIGSIMAVTAGLGLVIKKWVDHRQEIVENKKALVDLHNDYITATNDLNLNISTLEDLGTQYQAFAHKIKESGGTIQTALSAEEYKEFVSIQEQILGYVPDISYQIDIYGNKMLDLGDSYEYAAEKYKELYELQKLEFKAKAPEIIEGQLTLGDDFVKGQEEIEKANDKLNQFWDTVKVLDENIAKTYDNLNVYDKATYDKLFDNLVTAKNNHIQFQADWVAELRKGINTWGIAVEEELDLMQKILLNSPLVLEMALEAEVTNGEELIEFLEDNVIDDFVKKLDNIDLSFSVSAEGLDKLNQSYRDGKITQQDYLTAKQKLFKAFDNDVDRIIETNELTEEQIQFLRELQIVLRNSAVEVKGLNYEFLNVQGAITDSITNTQLLNDALIEYQEQGYLSQETLKALVQAFGQQEIATALANGTLEEWINTNLDVQRQSLISTKQLIEDAKAKILANKAELESIIGLGKAYSEVDQIRAEMMDIKQDRLVGQFDQALALVNNALAEIGAVRRGAVSPPKGGSTSGGKEEELYQAEIDAYHEINRLLAENQRLLDYNSEYIENEIEGSNEHINLLQKQNDLLANRQKLLEKLNIQRRAERDADIAELQRMGFAFEGIGDAIELINPENLHQLTKEEDIRRAEELIDNVYTMKDAIADAGLEWWDLSQAIQASRDQMNQFVQDLIDAEVEEEIRKANEAYKEQERQLDTLAKMQDYLVEFIRARGAEEKRILEENHKLAMEQLEKEYDDKKSAYEDDLDLFQKYINDKIDALNKEYAHEDYLKNLRNKQKDVLDIQKEIDILSLDNSMWAQNRKIELEEQLADATLEIADMQEDRERTLLQESLENQLSDYELFIKDKIEAADNEFDLAKKRLVDIQNRESASLEARYTNEKVYAEAREALRDGEVEDINGNLIDIQDAIEEMALKSGEQFGILGDRIRDDFIAALDDALTALEKLEDGALLPEVDERAIRRDVEERYNDRPIEFKDLSNREWKTYLRNKGDYADNQAKGYINTDPIQQALRAENEAIRDKYGIGADRYSYEDLINWDGYALGGKNVRPGLAMLHGTKRDPEWIFNDKQLQTILRQTVDKGLAELVPSTSNRVDTRPNIILNIENFIKANNITKESMPLLKQVEEDALSKLNRELNKLGVIRAVK